MPIHSSWSSLIDGLNSQYCKNESGAKKPFKCKKAQSVFYAMLRKNRWDETKPKPNSKKSDNDIISEALELFKEDLSKLTTKKRKSLPESSFCDPENRRYPAHDAAHVRNGLARIHQHPNDPKFSSILSCLKRKAKKFGVKVSDNENAEDTYFAYIRPDGTKFLQYIDDGMVIPEMLNDCLKTVDYMEELNDEEWFEARSVLFDVAEEYVKAVFKVKTK